MNVTVSGKLDVIRETEEKRAHEEPSKWADPVTWLTLVLAGANILLWLATRRLAEEAEEASRIAAKTATAAQESADAARDAFVASHRPEIRVKHVRLTSELWKCRPIEIELVIVNCGMTTAHITECNIATLVIPAEASLPDTPDYQRRPFVPSAEFRDITSGVTLVMPRLTDARTLTAAEHPGIRNLTHKLYCYGYIQYVDDATHIRTTAFSRYLHYPTHPGSVLDIGKFVAPKNTDPDYEYQD